MKEEAVLFGAGQSLVGIVTEPATVSVPRTGTAVVLLNAGIVHRVGPGRIYVKIARELAAMGFLVLRFDFSGIGDSAVRQDCLCFEKSAVAETQEAMQFLKAKKGVEHFVLLGGCSGAFASFEAAACDSRVVGAVLINFQIPEGESAVTLSDVSVRKAAYYYWNCALCDLKSWRNLLTGKTDYGQIMRVLRREVKRRFEFKKEMREMNQFEADLHRLAAQKIHTVFVCSEGDPRLQDLQDVGGHTLKKLCASCEVILDIIPRSDHTFSSVDDQERLLKVVCQRISTMPHRVVSRPVVAAGAERSLPLESFGPSPVVQAGTNSPQSRDL